MSDQKKAVETDPLMAQMLVQWWVLQLAQTTDQMKESRMDLMTVSQ